MTDDVVRAAYSARADEYAALLGSMDVMHESDRQFISGWAAAVPGHIVDAGCGPGHWTDFLIELGADVEGVDLVPAFVELARARFPVASFRVASLDDLGLPDRSAAGILAWYSLIHLEPERVPVVLGEFARCIKPHGGLAVGFVAGQRLERFSHAVTPAYFWPPDELAERIESGGFRVDEVHTRANPERPDRTHGAILAHRRDR
jgi:SAM-dependent methyltransferase